MKIVMGKLAGGEFKEGVSKAGKSFCICNFVLSTASKNCFEALPETISVPQEMVGTVRNKLLGLPVGSFVCCQIETQKRFTGDKEREISVFVDWFEMPQAGK